MKYKGKNKGLGLEWVYIFLDYYVSMNKRTAIYEILFPFIVSFICSLLYLRSNILEIAFSKLSEVLPATISILIGFTAMIVTLLITSDSEKIKQLTKKETKKVIRKKKVSLYQKIFIQNSHSLFNEILLLLIVFMYMFFQGLNCVNWIGFIFFLFIETYLVINILISIFSNITTIYLAFYSNTEK